MLLNRALVLVVSLLCFSVQASDGQERKFAWAVCGAGPAALVVTGLLMDAGVAGDQIAVIDPEFNVGRLSSYQEVPANSTMRSFIEFLEACKTFHAVQTPAVECLCNYELDKTCDLGVLVQVLRDISEYLCTKIVPYKSMLQSLDFSESRWHLVLADGQRIAADRVVLATGSHPRELSYSCETVIPLDKALNKSQLAQQVTPQDSVAVIGSAHSAVLIMKSLTELGVKKIVNLYNRPLQYTYETALGVMNHQFGLKGTAAEWAREVLEKNPPANLFRFPNTDAHRATWLPQCNKIIYAVGYERNELPLINGAAHDGSYDSSTGIIAPHLFGIGIAFPESRLDPLGAPEQRVGLNSFMSFAQQVLPLWQVKDIGTRFKSFDSFIMIHLL